jgi:hypothetical protein
MPHGSSFTGSQLSYRFQENAPATQSYLTLAASRSAAVVAIRHTLARLQNGRTSARTEFVRWGR